MVRQKDRYLLVNIIYNDVPPSQAKDPVPDLLLYNQPTTSELRPQHLLKAIRSEVAALFGDCGSGAIERSLQGSKFHTYHPTFIVSNSLPSEIPLSRHIHLHPPHLARPLPPRLGRARLHEPSSRARRPPLRLPRRARQRHHPQDRRGGRSPGQTSRPCRPRRDSRGCRYYWPEWILARRRVQCPRDAPAD
jgi:hypothetical protein